MAKKVKNKYKYDVALSFAGEDRAIAKKLCEELKKIGNYRVFYDEDNIARIWGKNHKELEHLYSKAPRYVIPIISENYANKDWPQWEFETANAEAKKRKETFLLPIRVDNTRLLGLQRGTFYVDLNSNSIKKIASLFNEIMKDKLEHKVSNVNRSNQTKTRLLNQEQRHVLGLIATSGMSIPLVNYKKLFPKIKWEKEIRTLKRLSFLNVQNRCLDVSKSAKNIFSENNLETEALHELWIKSLKPYENHIDIPVLQGFHYIMLRRFKEAAIVLTHAIDITTDTSFWTDLYILMLEKLTSKKIACYLSKDSKVELFNALGLCFLNKDDYFKAIEWFKHLRTYAKRVEHEWGIGQAYINQGVAEAHLGNGKASRKLYQLAISHARKTKDYQLLGRSLSNLGQMLISQTPDKAMAFLAEGLQAKKKIKDYIGITTSHLALGNFYVHGQQYKKAEKHYREAAKKAARLEHRHIEALAKQNIASTFFDRGEYEKAIVEYTHAKTIAEKFEYYDILIMAEKGIAQANYQLGRFGRASQSYKKLFNLNLIIGDKVESTIALHDMGACYLQGKNYQKAVQAFRSAMHKSRLLKLSDWTAQCIIDLIAAKHKNHLGMKGFEEIKKRAKQEQYSKKFTIAALLWEFFAHGQINGHVLKIDSFDVILSQWLNCLKKSDEEIRAIKLVEYWGVTYHYLWIQKDFEGGLNALRQMEQEAEKNSNSLEVIHAIDQQGICCQKLGRFSDAIKLHHKSIKLARKKGFDSEIAGSLNNLGEAFRKTAKIEAANKTFLEAEKISRELKDHESEIMTVHNRALLYLEKGDDVEGKILLVKCRELAKKHRVWTEYVRAWEALANLSASYGKNTLAHNQYKRALTEAKKQNLTKMLPRIALNLATLLNSQNKFKKAIQILKPFERRFDLFTDASLYYMTLGEIYQNCNKMEEAKESWLKAKEAAELLGDNDKVALCSGSLAEVYTALNKPKLSDRELCLTLRHEKDPELCAYLLVQRLELLLQLDKEKQADLVFEEARKLSMKHKLSDLYIDIYMLYGDYAWAKNKKYKQEALKFYIIAMSKSLGNNLEDHGDLVGHIFSKLVFSSKSITFADMNFLYTETKKWLSTQLKSKDICQSLLHPIKAASIALPFAEKPDQLQSTMEEYINKYLKDVD